jgi:hypothetical protein
MAPAQTSPSPRRWQERWDQAKARGYVAKAHQEEDRVVGKTARGRVTRSKPISVKCMRRSSDATLPSDLPLYVPVTNHLCENFISKLQGRNPILLVSHVDDEDVFTGADRTRADDLMIELATCRLRYLDPGVPYLLHALQLGVLQPPFFARCQVHFEMQSLRV